LREAPKQALASNEAAQETAQHDTHRLRQQQQRATADRHGARNNASLCHSLPLTQYH
jgi:hypothetical protein